MANMFFKPFLRLYDSDSALLLDEHGDSFLLP